jgi:hypothetical protein
MIRVMVVLLSTGFVVLCLLSCLIEEEEDLNQPLMGRWVNSDYDGRSDAKLVFKDDGVVDEYDIVDYYDRVADTVPLGSARWSIREERGGDIYHVRIVYSSGNASHWTIKITGNSCVGSANPIYYPPSPYTSNQYSPGFIYTRQ